MNSTPTLEEFLIAATGFPREQVIALYKAGDPWPLWTIHDIRKAGIIAQANAVLFPDALAEAQAATDAQLNTIHSRLESDDIPYGSISIEESIEAFGSIPWMKESAEHIERVRARTSAAWRDVVLFSNAIQRYAFLNPGWELMSSWPHMRRGLPN